MAKVLVLSGLDSATPATGNVDRAPEARRGRFRAVAPLQVITSRLESGERLPLLVEEATWLPRSLALRWVLFDRRWHCAESTLRRDVNSLRFVYAWGDRTFREGLDARLTAGPLEHHELLALRSFLSHPDAELRLGDARRDADVNRSGSAAGNRALAAKLFLQWALLPASRNDPGAAPADAEEQSARIDGVLQPLAKLAGHGRQREVLSDAALNALEKIVQPQLDAHGRFLRPLQWHPKNPFQEATRVRNWLMWTLARDSGLRLGEMLSLPVQPTAQLGGNTYVRVRTDADRQDDPRARSPQAKTLARLVPASPYTRFALQAYLTMQGKAQRARGNTYLFSSTRGRPLSYNAAARIMLLLSAAGEVAVQWHTLRHAWATEYAREVYRQAREGEHPVSSESAMMAALLVEKLRVLGGWSENSKMPAYYARVAIKEEADRLLRGIQNARAQRMATLRATLEPHWLTEPEEDFR